MSAHEGVSCDACGKSNFRSKRFKCLICYDYDLCSNCYEQGEISSNHTKEHPMQCILTRQDFDLYYYGEKCTSDQPQSLTCPLCGDMGLAFPFLNERFSSHNNKHNQDFFQHLQSKHRNHQQLQEVICPICASMVNGEPNLVTTDLLSHVATDHQDSSIVTSSSASREANTYLRQPSSTRDYDFGIGSGVRAGFRRGSLRTINRRGTLGRGNVSVNQQLVIDNPSGLATIVHGNDPITNLLAQLSNARRLATGSSSAINTNNSLTSTSNSTNLQTITRQQYERERLRVAGRSHHFNQSNDYQSSINTTNTLSSVESDFFDSIFSSSLFANPSTSPPQNHQNWPGLFSQHHSVHEQQSENLPKIKMPTATSTESDPSLLRPIFNESISSPSIQSNVTVNQSLKQRNDIVQSILLSSFTYSLYDE